jgi:hypothetical protein
MAYEKESQKVTYESGGCKTVVDYVLMRVEQTQMVSTVEVILSEAQVNNLCRENERECGEEEGGICN